MRSLPFDWRPYIIEFHAQAPRLMAARAFVLGGDLHLRLVGNDMTLEQAIVIDRGWVRAEAGHLTWQYRREQMLPALIHACIQHCVVEMTRDFHAVERLGILAMKQGKELRKVVTVKVPLAGVDFALGHGGRVEPVPVEVFPLNSLVQILPGSDHSQAGGIGTVISKEARHDGIGYWIQFGDGTKTFAGGCYLRSITIEELAKKANADAAKLGLIRCKGPAMEGVAVATAGCDPPRLAGTEAIMEARAILRKHFAKEAGKLNT